MPVIRRCSPVVWMVCLALCTARAAAAADTWYEVSSDHFTVVSNASEKRAREIAWQFEQMRLAITRGFPWAKVDLDRPLLVVAAKDEHEMRHMAPQYWEVRGGTRPSSVFVPASERHYILLQADVENERQGMNPHYAAYWSYSSLVMSASFDRPLPLWLTNGLSAVLSNTIVRDKEIQFGRPIPWHAERFLQLQQLTLDELFTIDRQSDFYRNADARARFDAQCWALVQYMLFASEGVVGAKFNAMTQLILNGADSRTAIARVFGDVEAVNEAYKLYIHQGFYRYATLPTEGRSDDDDFPTRKMTEGESAVVRAAFHAAMNRPVEAREALAEARDADATLPALDEVEAALLAREQKPDEAWAAMARAAAAGSTNFWVYYRLAVQAPGQGGAAVDAATRLGWLERATSLNPSFAPAFGALAGARAREGDVAGALEAAQVAVRLEPGEIAHRINVAQLLRALGRVEASTNVARAALVLSTDPRQRAVLQSMLESPAAPASGGQ